MDCCDHGIEDCGCNIGGASPGVDVDIYDVCVGDCDTGDGGEKDEWWRKK